ncbi:hypothetical protein DIS07_12690 [Polaribacter aquimarinus]|uniref:Glycosyltransferase RgtA/B/C/D-like domain-containing protein n=2 Tax=Polaribacter aquimarinus TaxID=2100726 RepID=A0A2U2J7E6_9FLAO|nr:hypothetical protein DIS07_12690 [Polaribacter aquimarinus]
MNKLQKNITTINFLLLSIVLLIYSYLRINNTLLRNIAVGDEPAFLKVFELYIKEGYYSANAFGNSTIFNLSSGFINYFIDNPLLSLKLSSLIFGFLCIVFLIKILNLKKSLTYLEKRLIIITAISSLVVSSIIFTGYNDVLVYFFTVLLFYFLEKLNLMKKNIKLSICIGVCFALMFLVRKMAVLFLVPFLLVFFHMHYKCYFSKGLQYIIVRFVKNIFIVTITSVLLLSFFNYPSLKEKKIFSFTVKAPEPSVKVNWIQRQYLSALKVEQGELEFGQHMSWSQTEDYIKINGDNSLPKTYFESITFNFKNTLKHFAFNVFYQIKPITRLIGLLFIIFLILKIIYIKSNLKFNVLTWNKILIFFISYLSILCFITFSYVEPRWYINTLILLPIPLVGYISKFKSNNNKKWLEFVFFNSQLVFLIIINIPYIIKNI